LEQHRSEKTCRIEETAFYCESLKQLYTKHQIFIWHLINKMIQRSRVSAVECSNKYRAIFSSELLGCCTCVDRQRVLVLWGTIAIFFSKESKACSNIATPSKLQPNHDHINKGKRSRTNESRINDLLFPFYSEQRKF